MNDPSKWVEESDTWNTEQHYEERKTQGVSRADWINFDVYLAWVIHNGIQRFRDEGVSMFSFPGEPEENWEALTNGEYEVMIKGFGQWAKGDFLDLGTEQANQVVRDLEDALEIFKSRFMQLWD